MNVVQLELWQMILLLLAFFGAVGAFGRVLLDQFEQRLSEKFKTQETQRAEATARWDSRFNELQSASQEESRNWHRVERQLLQLQAELPREYVRREDHIRFETVINAKLDALNAKIDLSNAYQKKD
jgi:predicted patatin/cPLA2 family phospholipase